MESGVGDGRHETYGISDGVSTSEGGSGVSMKVGVCADMIEVCWVVGGVVVCCQFLDCLEVAELKK